MSLDEVITNGLQNLTFDELVDLRQSINARVFEADRNRRVAEHQRLVDRFFKSSEPKGTRWSWVRGLDEEGHAVGQFFELDQRNEVRSGPFVNRGAELGCEVTRKEWDQAREAFALYVLQSLDPEAAAVCSPAVIIG
jgi:hypothetical protein